jgi:hypothetical protein
MIEMPDLPEAVDTINSFVDDLKGMVSQELSAADFASTFPRLVEWMTRSGTFCTGFEPAGGGIVERGVDERTGQDRDDAVVS